MRLSNSPYLLAMASVILLTACQSDLAPLTSDLQQSLFQPGYGTGRAGALPAQSPVRQPPAQATAAPVSKPAPVASTSPADTCSSDIVQQLLTPASSDPSPVKLACSTKLPARSVVTRQVVFEGSASSGSSLDCNGGRLEGTASKGDKDSVVVRSRNAGGTWSRPVGVTVRNCQIANGVRIYGLGRNGEAQPVKQSSLNADHTAFAQTSAPSGITFDNIRFAGSGGVPFYVSPGVTNVTLSNSRFTGTSSSVAVYLDAESAGANITDNTFDLSTNGREQIAIDGSAHNTITGNTFERASNGGIFVYRNCGEGGTIRHQAPQFNRIEGNTFVMNGSQDPAVWLNSRNGNRSYCFTDPSHPFGSALTSLDMAQNNTVDDNRAVGGGRDAFRNSDPTNRLANNHG
ncbi:right-handed parallel beta-helix repeat-containing protein [Neorhizobium sp. NCHU2750]|uniref:right-handed parallel beta-helix repeat-containing protein n=1 Tax=Neorhizobium sp. NCHU2750 TaxID=1825976 RepID=UPI000E7178B2|nr:hypothetical protein NCHU2750_01690 [Neorhizobium sp. NCHU2750]